MFSATSIYPYQILADKKCMMIGIMVLSHLHICFTFKILYLMNTKGHCYMKSIILQAVYFKPRFTLSYCDVKEIMKMSGISE